MVKKQAWSIENYGYVGDVSMSRGKIPNVEKCETSQSEELVKLFNSKMQ
jgi:hypothetical protein